MSCFSKSTTVFPASSSRVAATRPAVPAPMNATSTSAVCAAPPLGVAAPRRKSFGLPPAFVMASATALCTAIDVVVAPVTVSTSMFLASRILVAIIGAAVDPMPMVSSQRSTLMPAMSPPATVTCTNRSSSWPIAEPIHLPSVKLSGTLFFSGLASFAESLLACCGVAHPARPPSAATPPNASDPLRKSLRLSSIVLLPPRLVGVAS